jgi:hypothetical protein
LRGEVGAQRRVRGILRESECVERAPTPALPRKREREKFAVAPLNRNSF